MTTAGARVARRRKPSVLARVRAFWVIGLLVVALVTAGAVALANAPQLRVRAVEVSVSRGPVSTTLVRERAAITPDSNLWLLHPHAIARRVEAIPYVLAAAVHRSQFPSPRVRIDVTLRTPTACLIGASVATIDATGRVLQSGCAGADLPRIELGSQALPVPGAIASATEIARLQADAAALGAHLALRSVRLDAYGGLEAVDRQGVVLRLGEDRDLAAKLALVEPIRKAAGKGRRLRAIDLRSPATPVVEFP